MRYDVQIRVGSHVVEREDVVANKRWQVLSKRIGRAMQFASAAPLSQIDLYADGELLASVSYSGGHRKYTVMAYTMPPAPSPAGV